MLTIMTLNINGLGTKHGAWDRRREVIVDAIRGAEPDIVALQAVRDEPGLEGGDNQAMQLARLLPQYRHVIFRPGTCYKNGAADGSAVLSRLPIDAVESHELSHLPNTEDPWDRIVLHACFKREDELWHLFNAHFSWVSQQATDNVNEALAYVNSFSGPRVLVGDLNNTPDSTPTRRFRREGWLDAWSLLRGDDPGFTFESDRPSIRIDYVWIDASLKDRLLSVEQVARETTPDHVRASDHWGLLATFS